jgi:hypothetical protein
MTGSRRRRRKQLLDDVKEKGRCWKLKDEAPDCTVWRTRFVWLCTCRKADYGMNE